MHHFASSPRLKNQILGMTLHPFPPPARRFVHLLLPAFILKTAMTQKTTNDAETLSQRGLDLLAAGSAWEAADLFRSAIAADPRHQEAHHGLVRALRDAGLAEQSVSAALALTALAPDDPLAHTALSISFQRAGNVREAEAAAARARILEWKLQLQSPAE
jgi:tetratricopeptide (TPR) repeat protein